jgi:hypothetical protein
MWTNGLLVARNQDNTFRRLGLFTFAARGAEAIFAGIPLREIELV